jgi:hypothetical protein
MLTRRHWTSSGEGSELHRHSAGMQRGCSGSTLYVPEMGEADRETFGNLAGFEEMARGYNYILYLVFESEKARDNYDVHPAHMALNDECLALWVGDASESALVFDLRLP